MNWPGGLPVPGAYDGVEDYGGSPQASSFRLWWKGSGGCCRAEQVGSGHDLCSGRAGPVVVPPEGVPGEAAREGSGSRRSRNPPTVGRPRTGDASSGEAGTRPARERWSLVAARWTTCPPETGRARTGGRALNRPSVGSRPGSRSGSRITARASAARGARRSSWPGKTRGTAGQADLFASQARSRSAGAPARAFTGSAEARRRGPREAAPAEACGPGSCIPSRTASHAQTEA